MELHARYLRECIGAHDSWGCTANIEEWSDSQMVIQRTPIKPNSLTYLKNFYPNFFPKNCKMLDPGAI